MIRTSIALLSSLVLSTASVLAQQPPPLPPAVGNAVLLSTNSIHVARNTVVTTGDLVVNHASGGPVLGELELSVDQGVRTPPGFALKANGVDVDSGAIVSGDVHYNVLQNDGTINGALVTPLTLPVIGTLPQLIDRAAGTENIAVDTGAVRILGRGNYADLVIGRDATLRLPGGPYTFASITVERGGSIIWDGPGEVVVRGRMALGAETTIGAAPGVFTKRKMFFVHGGNGTDGLLLSTPPAVSIGRDSAVSATIHAPNGSIVAGEALTLLGSFVARDIGIGRDSRLTLRSGFRNLPPVAFNQNVTVSGEGSVAITLSGFDPDSDPLIFSIGIQPTNGTLGPITPTGPTSAVVIYTPRAERDTNDVFTFRVTDSEGFVAQGVVTINEGLPLPGPPTTVIVEDLFAIVPPDRPTIIALPAIGPPGVPLTLSIVPNSGPSPGSLGPLSQPQQMPPRPGQVVYVPPPGYTGEDLFRFRACGTIAGVLTCDEGTVFITVEGPPPPPEIAPDLTANVISNTASTITIGTLAGPPPPPGPSYVVPAAIAGNVADANGDGAGDNVSPLPGPAPVLMSAGIGQTGDPGSNGTVRMHFEWDISAFGELAPTLQSATVLLRTNRGPNDTAPTFFYAGGTSGDGQLSVADYTHPSEQLSEMMVVPTNQPVGADGTFNFDVLDELRTALQNGFTHFVIQGRLRETTEAEGAENGLHVYTTASGNATGNRLPQLGIGTASTQPARVHRVLTLPSNGTLRDGNGAAIRAVPYVLPSRTVTYQSNAGFTGADSFTYDATQEPQTDTGTVTITVAPGDGDGRD